MKQEHLLENELQQLALGQQINDHELAAHVHECAKCAIAITNYQAMFSALKTMERPAVNFDIEQIMAALPVSNPEKKGFPWLIFWVSSLSTAIVAVSVFRVSGVYLNLFRNSQGPVLYLIVATALTIVVFQLRELISSYREKMRQLNFY
ncbi:hypothetical protein A4D02_09060 [Niastella koreensis]|uniref:Uncharacterized protein n=2 Tax=Niastella koreensis TaxID=354356 RepID=G8TKK8_NIAKG|nr:hypothetical protein [Niastella koreensis]AEV98682.1 hypothetical protein Niako_2338 [Niastella koreensis GR20-10]OQP44925.1 hypothetical protein A4D02_09060 [Niastella koreensis]